MENVNINWAGKKYLQVLLNGTGGYVSFILYSEDNVNYTEPFSNRKFWCPDSERLYTVLNGKNTNLLDNKMMPSIIFETDIKRFYKYLCNKKKGKKIVKYFERAEVIYKQLDEETILKDAQKQEEDNIRQQQLLKTKNYYADRINQLLQEQNKNE